jgi:transposase-like protein
MQLKPYKEEQVCDACEELSLQPTYCEEQHEGKATVPHLHYACQSCGYKWATETAHPIKSQASG